jgi:hypothetical protein
MFKQFYDNPFDVSLFPNSVSGRDNKSIIIFYYKKSIENGGYGRKQSLSDTLIRLRPERKSFLFDFIYNLYIVGINYRGDLFFLLYNVK